MRHSYSRPGTISVIDKTTYRHFENFVKHDVWRDVEVEHEVLGEKSKKLGS